jgi:DNA-binding transcriptional LysR family regulator
VVNLDRLQHAVKVAQEGSFTAAAHAIPLSQSALTRSIQMLERQYSLKIFERTKLGAQLTPEGADFIEIAQRLVQSARSGEEELRAAKSAGSSLVRFGMGSISAAVFLPDMLTELTAHSSDYRVWLGSSAALRSALRRREIDFYIAGVPRNCNWFANAHDLTIERVGGNYLDLLARPDHPIYRRPLVPGSFREFPIGAGTFVRETIGAAVLDPFGIRLPQLEIDDYEMLASVARASDLIVIGSHLFRTLRPDLGLRVIPYDISGVGRSDWAVVTSLAGIPSAAYELSRVILARLSAAIAGAETIFSNPQAQIS